MIDFNSVTRTCGGDAGLAAELAEVFLQEYPGYLEAIDEAMQEHSSNNLVFAAHRLRGSLILFKVQGAIEAATQLETLGANSQFATACEVVAVLKRELSQVEREMRALIVTGAQQ